MADKQATVYIIDQGRSMGERNGGRDESDLDFGMRYIWDKIAATMATARKTWTVGVIGLRTDGSDNPLKAEEGYDRITIMQPIVGPFETKHLKKLQNDIKVSKTDTGDAISAVVIAIDMIEKFTKKLKYFRKIVLMTNGRGHMDADDIEEITRKLNEVDIELVVVGIDFDDAEYGFKEEDKDPFKSSNEGLLKTLVSKCNKGTFGTAAEAVELLSIPVVKETRPYKAYDGQLTLGDPDKYDSAMCIDVERYFRTKKATPPSASNFVVKVDPTSKGALSVKDQGAGHGDDADLVAVKQTHIYKVDDPSNPSIKKAVDREDLAKGYEYGRTAVHISESDQNVTRLETLKVFTILGFIPSEKYERFLNMGESCVTIAQRTNDKARMAFSSLVHALFELDSYAVARIVLKDDKDPKLVLLAPLIEPDLECLIDVPLPFAEDLRQYRFPPLNRVITVSGATITKHRNIPTDDLVDTMSAYVDSMDLSAAGKDEEGNPTEYCAIEDTYSPVLHRIQQTIRLRATRPDEPVPPPAEILIKYSNPPEDLVKSSKKQIAALIKAADVKKVPPETKGKRGRDTITPLSGLDVESLLVREKRQKITADNAVAEFKQALATSEEMDVVEDAVKQMLSIVRSLLTHSLGDANYARAIENLGVVREELVALEVPELYNSTIRELRTKVLGSKLGGDRRDFWFKLRAAKLGLVTKEVSDLSDISEEQAAEFYSMKSSVPIRSHEEC